MQNKRILCYGALSIRHLTIESTTDAESSTDDSQQESFNPKEKTRKRLRQPDKWNRNVLKTKVNTGQTHS